MHFSFIVVSAILIVKIFDLKIVLIWGNKLSVFLRVFLFESKITDLAR